MSSYTSGQDLGTSARYDGLNRVGGKAPYTTLIALFAGTVLGSIGTFLLEAAYVAASR